MHPALQLIGISMRLGDAQVLDGLNLAVAEGESVALLGVSGSGKTTALRITAGFLQPTAGRVMAGAADVTRLPPERRRMAMIHQRFLLFPHLSASDNVAFGMRYASIPRREQPGRVKELLTLVGLDGCADRYPHELSGGQQQRVAIARALAVRPSILLLDEPLNNLDSTLREHLLDELRAMQRSAGMAMLYVTHDQSEAARIAGRVALLDDGRILQVDAFDRILERPASARVARVLGFCNLYTVKIEAGTLEVPELGWRTRSETIMDGQALAYLPPDKIRLEKPAEDWLSFIGTVEETISGAFISRLSIRRDTIRLSASASREELARAKLSPGDTAVLYFPREAVRLLPADEDGMI